MFQEFILELSDFQNISKQYCELHKSYVMFEVYMVIITSIGVIKLSAFSGMRYRETNLFKS